MPVFKFSLREVILGEVISGRYLQGICHGFIDMFDEAVEPVLYDVVVVDDARCRHCLVIRRLR